MSRALLVSPPLRAAPLNVGLSTAYPGLQELPGLPVDSGTLRRQVQHRGQVLLQLVALHKHPQKEQHVRHAELSLCGSRWRTRAQTIRETDGHGASQPLPQAFGASSLPTPLAAAQAAPEIVGQGIQGREVQW